MGKTKKNKLNKNKTRKNKETQNPDVKILQKGDSLYGAKNKSLGLKILDYTRSQ
jgi:hypothetical protein